MPRALLYFGRVKHRQKTKTAHLERLFCPRLVPISKISDKRVALIIVFRLRLAAVIEINHGCAVYKIGALIKELNIIVIFECVKQFSVSSQVCNMSIRAVLQAGRLS